MADRTKPGSYYQRVDAAVDYSYLNSNPARGVKFVKVPPTGLRQEPKIVNAEA